MKIRQKNKTIVHNQVSKDPKPSKRSVKSRTNADTHRITEDYEILDGAVKVIRTTKSGNFWSMSCWLREERKCYRRALHTKNLEEAKELAREEYFRLKGDIRAGNKIYSITARELVDAFIKHKESEANSGFITHGRVSTIKVSLNKWFLYFVGEGKKLDKITRHDFQEYFVWRRKEAPEVRNATLINERALISSVFKFGITRGFLKHEQSPIFPRLNIKKSQVERRDSFDYEEWVKFYSVFPNWIKQSTAKQETAEKKFVRDFIVILTNTGLRFGEARKLTWRMIKTFKNPDQGNPLTCGETHVSISVPEDTKTGARTVIGRRGDIFERIRKHSNFTKPDDFIFVNNETGAQLHKKVYYKHWNELLKISGLADVGKKLTYYSLRHTYITFRLLAGTDAFMLAKNSGTSVRMIETHYEHIKSDKIKRELTKSMRQSLAGQILLD